MIEKWCAELSNKFPDIELHEYVIMPNHFHAIIMNVGANLCVRPYIPWCNGLKP
jgi:REP element-mobilizing transposase RayT